MTFFVLVVGTGALDPGTVLVQRYILSAGHLILFPADIADRCLGVIQTTQHHFFAIPR